MVAGLMGYFGYSQFMTLSYEKAVNLENGSGYISDGNTSVSSLDIDTLTIKDSVGDSEVTVSKSKIEKLLVNGGGVNSINLDDTSVKMIEVNKSNQTPVRIFLSGKCEVDTIIVKTRAIIESDSNCTVNVIEVESDEDVTSLVLKDVVVEKLSPKSLVNVYLEEDSLIGETTDDDMIHISEFECGMFYVAYLDDNKYIAEKMFGPDDVLSFPFAEKEGYRLLGWLNDGVIAEEIPVKENMVLKADYERKSYTVQFDTLCDELYEPLNVLYGDDLSKVKDPKREGYIFTGWESNGEYFDLGTGVTRDILLTATWFEGEQQEHQVRFFDSEGNLLESQTVVSGQIIHEFDYEEILEGYDFEGWINNVTGKLFNFSDRIFEDCDFVPSFVKHVSVSFDSNGGSQIDSILVVSGEVSEIDQKPLRPGFDFMGWYYDGERIDNGYMFDKDITVTAHWEKAVELYEVHLSFNNADYSAYNVEVRPGEYLDLPSDMVCESYRFLGWTVYNQDGYIKDNRLQINDPFVVVIAEWEPIPRYGIFFRMDRAGEEFMNLMVYEGNDFSWDIPVREGYRFSGWYDHKTGEKMDLPRTVTVSGNINVYAKWEKIIYKTVNFDSDGGTMVNPITDELNSVVSLPVPEKSGYRFDGWTDVDGQHVSDDFNLINDCTLKAAWVRQYSITLNPVDGEISYVTVDENTVVKLTTPTRKDYNFICWTDGTNKYGDSVQVSSDMVLNAEWEEIHYATITFKNDGTAAEHMDSITGIVGDVITLPVPSNDNYLFWGWIDEETGAMLDSAVVLDKSLVLVPRYKRIYTLIYYVDGVQKLIDTRTIIENEPTMLLPMARQITEDRHENAIGYNYKNNIFYSCSGTIIPDFDETTVRLYAVWPNEPHY